MRSELTVLIASLIVLAGSGVAGAQQPTPQEHQQHHMPMMMCPMMGGMTPSRGMMQGGGMMPMMGMMGGGQMDPKARSQMLQMQGEMMKAMGEVMMKHGKAMEGTKP